MVISCVSEIQIPDINGSVLAVGIQYESADGGMISIFSVQGARVLRSIEIREKITSLCHIPHDVLFLSKIKYFDGIVYGTEMGEIFILDLCYKKCLEGKFIYYCTIKRIF